MKSMQAPHQKLDDIEIRELILDIVFELNETKQNLLYEIEQIELNLNRLKRHFCPDKFQVFVQELTDMSKPEETDGVAEAE